MIVMMMMMIIIITTMYIHVYIIYVYMNDKHDDNDNDVISPSAKSWLVMLICRWPSVGALAKADVHTCGDARRIIILVIIL